MSNEFDWHPSNFAGVVQTIESASPQIKNIMRQAIKAMGSLSCPAPVWDSTGIYRVVSEGEKIAIQKRESDGKWITAPLSEPSK